MLQKDANCRIFFREGGLAFLRGLAKPGAKMWFFDGEFVVESW
jgi:hypothetical protein